MNVNKGNKMEIKRIRTVGEIKDEVIINFDLNNDKIESNKFYEILNYLGFKSNNYQETINKCKDDIVKDK